MNFKHLKHERCPSCGHPVVCESLEAGEIETQKFSCGYEVRWIPGPCGFERVVRECPLSDGEVAKQSQRKRAYLALTKFIREELEADWEFLDDLEEAVKPLDPR